MNLTERPQLKFTLEAIPLFTLLFSVISLAFYTGMEAKSITHISNRERETAATVALLQTTLPVQMATIQAKLDDISYQLKHQERRK